MAFHHRLEDTLGLVQLAGAKEFESAHEIGQGAIDLVFQLLGELQGIDHLALGDLRAHHAHHAARAPRRFAIMLQRSGKGRLGRLVATLQEGDLATPVPQAGIVGLHGRDLVEHLQGHVRAGIGEVDTRQGDEGVGPRRALIQRRAHGIARRLDPAQLQVGVGAQQTQLRLLRVGLGADFLAVAQGRGGATLQEHGAHHVHPGLRLAIAQFYRRAQHAFGLGALPIGQQRAANHAIGGDVLRVMGENLFGGKDGLAVLVILEKELRAAQTLALDIDLFATGREPCHGQQQQHARKSRLNNRFHLAFPSPVG